MGARGQRTAHAHSATDRARPNPCTRKEIHVHARPAPPLVLAAERARAPWVSRCCRWSPVSCPAPTRAGPERGRRAGGRAPRPPGVGRRQQLPRQTVGEHDEADDGEGGRLQTAEADGTGHLGRDAEHDDDAVEHGHEPSVAPERAADARAPVGADEAERRPGAEEGDESERRSPEPGLAGVDLGEEAHDAGQQERQVDAAHEATGLVGDEQLAAAVQRPTTRARRA